MSRGVYTLPGMMTLIAKIEGQALLAMISDSVNELYMPASTNGAGGTWKRIVLGRRPLVESTRGTY